MSRKTFSVVVALVVVFVAWAIIVGNRMSAKVKGEIAAEKTALVETRKSIEAQRAQVVSQAAANPELFAVRGFANTWPNRFADATRSLGEAARVDDQLTSLVRANRRSSEQTAERLVDQARRERLTASREAMEVVTEAQKRVDFRKNFSSNLEKTQSRARAFAALDLAPVTHIIEKAESDWPVKKDQLQTRLDALQSSQKEARESESAVATLAAKPAATLTSADYARVLDLDESLSASGDTQARVLQSQAHQLYTSWDDVLDDLDRDHDVYRERTKRIETTVPAPGAKGTTTSSENWTTVSPEAWHAVEKDIGMSIAHKPLGRFDSEADTTPQPPGFAYMASPAEGRNQYGYWDNRGGTSVWTWLPEYLILRDLLTPRYYQPIPSWEWGRYQQARRYGQTYYGRDETSGTPKYGSHGTFTARSYSNSRYAQTGGFGSSKYASGGGGFSGSKYGGATASAPSSSSGQRFGSSASSSAGKRYGGSSGKSFGASRSAGRSFGGGRRR